MTQRHIIGNRPEFTCFNQIQIHLLLRHGILAEQDPSIQFSVDGLNHLTLSPTTCPFMHDGNDIVVRSDDPDGGTMSGHPTLFLPDFQQHAIDTLFCTGPWIQVVGEHLIHTVQSIVDNHLFSLEMSMTECRD
ncbi:hypothetical protein SDC9_107908 [bioreactor metagenome]|uniref:Uncharacterized protein n=1 Tax=bioreactor metagenome TaxID=1076179 RepID=A0A645BH22_9ZZZZ